MLKTKILFQKIKIPIHRFTNEIYYDNKFNVYYNGDITSENLKSLTYIINGYNLENMAKLIKLHITSSGGDIEPALGCYDQLKLSKIPIHTYAEGSVHSAASIIFLAGRKRYMTQNTHILIHQLYCSQEEEQSLQQVNDYVYNLNMLMEKCKKIYLERTKMDCDTLDALLKRDIFLDAKTCKKHGIVHKIL